MKDFEAWKKCKFCGMRLGKEIGKCPNCGSSNIQLITHKYMELVKHTHTEEEETVKASQSERRGIGYKWKRVLRSIVIVLFVMLLICIVGSFLISQWVEWMTRKEVEKVIEDTEIIETTDTNSTQEHVREEELSDEEWLEMVLPILNKWYAQNADEQILKIHEKALKENRPIYEWDHYMYAATLYEFSIIENIWERERAGIILQDYENTDLLNYYFLYWDFEDSFTYTDEEKVWLQKYVNKLREDVEWRFGLTQKEWKTLYTDVTAEFGYVDYQKVKEYVENSEVWIASVIKATETLDDNAWKDKIFPVLDELYEEGRDEELILIYGNTRRHHKSSRPFEEWEHDHYVDYVWDIMNLEPLLQDVDEGKRLSEMDYSTILKTYFRYADYVDANIMTAGEKERFAPYFDKLEEYATTLWDFSQGEWKDLLEKSKTEYVGDEIEMLVHKWLRETEQ